MRQYQSWLTDCKLHRKKIYGQTLTGKPLSEEVQEVLEERDALYREVAHIIIDATNEPSQVISEIRSALAQTINC
ncbi:shikimate kinase [Escherichia coli]